MQDSGNNIPVIQVPPVSRGRIQRLKVFPIPCEMAQHDRRAALERYN